MTSPRLSRRPAARRARVRRMAARLLSHWAQTTAADASAGLGWYRRARGRCRVIADATGLDLESVAGIVAALSPRCHWAVNLQWAARVALAKATGGDCPVISLGHCRRKAWDIANGARPLDTLRGPKVLAFYRAITGDRDSVTVDTWAALAATGRPTRRGVTGKRYDEIAEAYRLAARLAGVSPRELQAAVWVHVRGYAD